MERCTHDGFHSGEAHYCRDLEHLRYVVVCDACRLELRELSAVLYCPRFEPDVSTRERMRAGGRR